MDGGQSGSIFSPNYFDMNEGHLAGKLIPIKETKESIEKIGDGKALKLISKHMIAQDMKQRKGKKKSADL